jgi:hypothetical protein
MHMAWTKVLALSLAVAPLPASIAAALTFPRLNKPAIAVDFAGADFVPVAATGSGLGTAGTLVVSGTLNVPSTQTCDTNPPPCIVFWKDEEVAAKLPRPTSRPVLRVLRADNVRSNSVHADRYRLTAFPTNPGVLVGGGVVDAQGDVWVYAEGHASYDRFHVDPSDPNADPTRIPLPVPFPAAPTFYWEQVQGCLNGCLRNSSAAAEDFLAPGLADDPKGRIWQVEGGPPEVNRITFPNHHRVLSYSTVNHHFQFYNIPGDDDGAEGLAWDRARHVIWMTAIRTSCGSTVMTPARLIRFDPDDPAHPANDGTVPFPTPVPGVCSLPPIYDCPPPHASCTCPAAPGVCLDGSGRNCFADDDCAGSTEICPFNAPTPGCRFMEYPLPGEFWPAHVAVDKQGLVWFADYFCGARLGRLDPADGSVQFFPLPQGRSPACFDTPFPWDVRLDRQGGIVVTEFGNDRVVRFDPHLLGSASLDCHDLDAAGNNPCLRVFPVPEDDPTTETILTVAFDRHKNVWFSQGGPVEPNAPQSVGYVWKSRYVVMFPPLSLLDAGGPPSCPLFGSGKAFEGAGVGSGPGKDEIWTVDACAKLLVRLQKQ